MKTTNDITILIETELKQFDDLYRESLSDYYEPINTICKYLLKQNGKRMRPILTLLSAKLFGQITVETIQSAVILEMLHNATLIHDDVIDQTNQRRGSSTINALWNNKTAVLMGDYLFSTCLSHAANIKNSPILSIIAHLGKEMSRGEIIQMDKASKLDIVEESYFLIIDKKTAVLFSSCAKAGAITAGANTNQVELMTEFGSHLGMAFQIKDDILDYVNQGNVGKPSGNDIRENKITLPLIHALQHATPKQKSTILDLLKSTEKSDETVHQIIQFAIENNGITYAQQRMNEYGKKANDILSQLPETAAKAALLQFTNFVLEREK